MSEVDRLKAVLYHIEQLAMRCDEGYYAERPMIGTGYRSIAALATLALRGDGTEGDVLNGEWPRLPPAPRAEDA